jgi:hypothetical protein
MKSRTVWLTDAESVVQACNVIDVLKKMPEECDFTCTNEPENNHAARRSPFR